MKPLRGVISDRLRKLLSPSDPAWTPVRGSEPPRPVPKHVDGHGMTGRAKRRK